MKAPLRETELRKAIDSLQSRDPDAVRRLYEQYSHWARHHHTLVWTLAAFGVSISLGALVYFREAPLIEFSVVCLGSVALLVITKRIADSNRMQWQEFWGVLNTIESIWGLRSEGAALRHPLLPSDDRAAMAVTRDFRHLLVRVCILLWLAALAVKILRAFQGNG
jgi:hypothetical protein